MCVIGAAWMFVVEYPSVKHVLVATGITFGCIFQAYVYRSSFLDE